MKEKIEATTTSPFESKLGQNGSSVMVEEFAEEEGRGVVENEQIRLQMMAQQQQLQQGIEGLRKRFENNSELQKNMWDMLTYVLLLFFSLLFIIYILIKYSN